MYVCMYVCTYVCMRSGPASPCVYLPCRDDGVGLAAPQVGVNLRLMVFNETGERDRKDKEMVLVNPYIVSVSRGVVVAGLLAEASRQAEVQVAGGMLRRRGRLMLGALQEGSLAEPGVDLGSVLCTASPSLR